MATKKEIVRKHFPNVYFRPDGLIHGDINANDIISAMQEYAELKCKTLIIALGEVNDNLHLGNTEAAYNVVIKALQEYKIRLNE